MQTQTWTWNTERLPEPARVVRQLTLAERAQVRNAADHYARNATYCLQHQINVGGPLPP